MIQRWRLECKGLPAPCIAEATRRGLRHTCTEAAFHISGEGPTVIFTAEGEEEAVAGWFRETLEPPFPPLALMFYELEG